MSYRVSLSNGFTSRYHKLSPSRIWGFLLIKTIGGCSLWSDKRENICVCSSHGSMQASAGGFILGRVQEIIFSTFFHFVPCGTKTISLLQKWQTISPLVIAFLAVTSKSTPQSVYHNPYFLSNFQKQWVSLLIEETSESISGWEDWFIIYFFWCRFLGCLS